MGLLSNDSAQFSLADLLRQGKGLLSSAAGGIQAADQRMQQWSDDTLGRPVRGLLGISEDETQRMRAMMQSPEVQMALSLMPMGVGTIKSVGKMPKKGIIPSGISPEMVPPGPSQMFGEGMSGTIKQMTDGDYLGRYMPAWLAPGKSFYAIGDDAEELKNFMLKRMSASEKGTKAATTAKVNKSLIGQLGKLGFDPSDFKEARSTQSASEYLTHTPSGTKIRISDHDLPLHYDQPDVDLRSWMSDEEKIAAIKAALE